MGKYVRCKKWLIWIESLLLAVIPLILIYKKYGVYFETNDDRMINEILAGVLSGTSDGHAIYVNYLLGGLLARLYSNFPTIPWYGGLLLFSHMCAYWCFFGVVLERAENVFRHILGIICGLFLLSSNVYIFGEIQYTSTAAVLAVAGYFVYLFDNSRYRKYILFALFELTALLLRNQAMYMIQIMGITLVGIGLVEKWWKEKQKRKEVFREGITISAILASCLFLGLFGDYCLGDYGSEEWKAYTYFKDIGVGLADYYGFPAYEKAEEVLTRYGVSENEYIAFTRYWILNNDIDIECLEELHQIAKEDYESRRSSFLDILKSLLGSRFQWGIMGYGKYTLMLYAFVGALCLVKRDWFRACELFGLNVSRNVVLGYLVYRGRLPFRVLSGLYVMEMFFLLAWLYMLLKNMRKEKLIVQLGVATVSIAVTVIATDTIKETYSGLEWKHDGRVAYSSGMDELIDYFTASDKGYLCVEMATSYYTGDVLDMSWYKNRNYLSSGFWWSNSPNITKYQQAYLDEHQGNMRLVEMGAGMDVGQSYAYKLFTEDWGMELDFVEQIELSNGVVLDVYDINGM